jgi:DNA primase
MAASPISDRSGRIDARAIRERVDLLELIRRDVPGLRKVATTRGGEWAGPCPFCPDGGSDRLRVQPVRGQWWCRHCSGERWQDAIAYVMQRDGVGFLEAASRLDGAPVNSGRPARSVPVDPEPEEEAEPPAAWRAETEALVARCEAALWSPAGAWARGYLREWRGLTDDTIRRWRLGWRVDPRGRATGVVLPWYVDGALWQVKTRRLRPDLPYDQAEVVGDPKYLSLSGGHPLLYGADTLAGHPTAFLVEGEFDAILLHQAAGDLAGVVTLGGCNKRPGVGALTLLLPVARVLLAYDQDAEGAKGAERLAFGSRRIRRVNVPAGKDVTDCWRRGGDLRAWATWTLGGGLAVVDADTAELPNAAGVVSAPAPLDDLPGVVLHIAAELDWPKVTIVSGQAIGPGEADWRRVVESSRLVEPHRGLVLGGLKGALTRRLAGVPAGSWWAEYGRGGAR